MRLYREKDKIGIVPNLGLTEAYRLLSQSANDGGYGTAGYSIEGELLKTVRRLAKQERMPVDRFVNRVILNGAQKLVATHKA